VQETFAEMTELARSTVNAMRLVKIYSREVDQAASFDRLGRQYIRHNMGVATVQGLLFPVSGLVSNLSLLLVVVAGGRMAIDGLITIGDFIAFMSYLFMLVWPMMAIGWVANLFQRGGTSLARLQAILGEQPTLQDEGPGLPLPLRIESLELRDLSFCYPPSTAKNEEDAGLAMPENRQHLRGISLTLTPGLTGLLGPTGSGKSTLCHLVARLYPVPDGCVFINGIDLNRIGLESYRRAVAYAPQEPFLFADTIAANIGFGKPGASSAEIERAAKAVGLHDEIVHFAEGYASRIGEKGVMLSGGQRQRLSLARAMLTQAPLLIIDDGLSAVDAGTEGHIMAAIASYSRTAIVLMTSHRLAPLAEARQLGVVEDGCLTAWGGHQELLAQNAYYRAIYHKQTEPDHGGNHAA